MSSGTCSFSSFFKKKLLALVFVFHFPPGGVLPILNQRRALRLHYYKSLHLRRNLLILNDGSAGSGMPLRSNCIAALRRRNSFGNSVSALIPAAEEEGCGWMPSGSVGSIPTASITRSWFISKQK